jgi:hypothetical protein
MTTHNTFYDSANTATRAFLTKAGAFYNNGKSFNVSLKYGKMIWVSIIKEFSISCAYCGDANSKITMEHLIMMNREECGLHHPGNVVPCCKECNKRGRSGSKHLSWKEHLKIKAGKEYSKRLRRINGHIRKYKYPTLSDDEEKSIKVIARSLYENTLLEGNKSFKLYLSLREEFIRQ